MNLYHRTVSGGSEIVMVLTQKKINLHMCRSSQVSFGPLGFMETWVEKGVIGGEGTVAHMKSDVLLLALYLWSHINPRLEE